MEELKPLEKWTTEMQDPEAMVDKINEIVNAINLLNLLHSSRTLVTKGQYLDGARNLMAEEADDI